MRFDSVSFSKISSYFALPNSCPAPGHGRSSEIRNQTHSKRVSPANSCGKLLSWVTKTDENYYHHTGCWIMVICDYVSVSLPPHLASDTVNLVLGRKYEGRITYITFRQQILVGNYSPKWRKNWRKLVSPYWVLFCGDLRLCHCQLASAFSVTYSQSGAGPAIRR